jgi:hypothetical protein
MRCSDSKARTTWEPAGTVWTNAEADPTAVHGCCIQLDLAETPTRRRAAIPLLRCRILPYQTQESIWRRSIRTNAGRFAVHSDRATLSLDQIVSIIFSSTSFDGRNSSSGKSASGAGVVFCMLTKSLRFEFT